MKAVVIDGYGGSDVLHVREVATPVAHPGEVLIRVRAAGVNPVDWKIRRGDIRPFVPRRFPFIPGGDIAGEVETLGEGASRFRPGTPVFALCGAARGGGYAEFVAVKEDRLARKPEAWSFEEAAAVPIAGLTALQALRDLGGLGEGQSVLVNGASGGVGHLAVPIARVLGARVVAATCGPRNVDFVRALGADPVLDYTHDDFTRRSDSYDVIFDAVATSSFPACRLVLKPAGTYIATLPSPSVLFWSAAQAFRLGPHQRARFIHVKASGVDLDYLARLADDGRLRPTLDRVLPLDQVREAHTASEGGHTRGKIVLKID
jgi:NADPH:quinone reductase-like Zn-dependent oxidoreductase